MILSQRFEDSLGRQWDFTLDMGIVDRCFRGTGFNPLSLIRPEGAKKLEDDPSLHLMVLFELLRTQAEAAKIDIESFKSGLKDLDAMERCGKALTEALINFSPSRLRDQMRQMNQKGEQYQAAVLKGSTDLIQQIDPDQRARETIAKLRAAITTGSSLLGNAPGQSASIPVV